MAQFRQDFDQIKRTCLQNNALWEDPLFPAANQSLYHSRDPPKPFEWKRPSELIPNPQLFVGGATRFDATQGMLDNSWFVTAVASLSLNENLLHQVVPPDQSFQRDYAGIFKFRFWQYGEWVDICVDDRLPSYHRRLVFVRSDEQNEFWSALLEKAYAKLHRSYEGLKGGNAVEAMEDFTGGLSETFELKNDEFRLFGIFLQAHVRGSQLSCSINATPAGTIARLGNGLLSGQVYTITSVKQVNIITQGRSGTIGMIRIRNPLVNTGEWKGAWSDLSSEWRNLSSQEKQEMGLTFDDDGEFWMSFRDFLLHFDRVDVCHLGPDRLAGVQITKQWVSNFTHGRWQRNVTAGGCRTFPDTFWTNPQIEVNLEEEDDEGDGCTFIMALMQKNRRKQRSGNLTIGFSIFEYEGTGNRPLGKDFFLHNASKARSSTFNNEREICDRFKLPKGRYIIVPSTFEPNLEGDFLVRVYSMKPASQQALDEQTGPIPDHVRDPAADDQMAARFREFFKKLSGNDMEIDAWELQEVLNSTMKEELDGSVSLVSCKGIVAIYDTLRTCLALTLAIHRPVFTKIDLSGKLGFEEFMELWTDIRSWMKTFKKYDTDRSGTFNSYELRRALCAVGFKLSNKMLQVMVLYYADKTGGITLDNFIASAVKLKHTFQKFSENTSGKDEAKFSLENYLMSSMYY